MCFKSRSGDRHTEFVANGEIARGETSGVMILGKEHERVRSVDRSPVSDTPLEGTAGRILELADLLLLEVTKKSDGA